MEPQQNVVWISHKDGDPCVTCGDEMGKGRFVQVSRTEGVRCMKCAGFGDLVFLPAGDPAVTRRAVAASSKHAVVVKFSRARKRHERQGVLVEESAVALAEQECARDAAEREAKAEKRRAGEEIAEREYVLEFARKILERFPSCPPREAEEVARHACQKYSGRIGRSAAAKDFAPEAIDLAVRARVRHRHTGYDGLLADGIERRDARPLVRPEIEEVLARWRLPAEGPTKKGPAQDGV